MPKSLHPIDQTFTALADPARHAVVQALSEGPASVPELAQPFDMALPSVTQHLGVLEDAGLISSRRKGRRRIYALNPSALKQAEDWMATARQHWETRSDRFDAHLADSKTDIPHD